MNTVLNTSAAELNSAFDAGHPAADAVRLYSFGSENKTKGSILVIPGAPTDEARAARECAALSADFHLCCVLNPASRPEDQDDFTARLVEKLESEKLKRLTLVGIGSGAAIAMRVVLSSRELVRRFILIDATSHKPVEESSFVRFMNKMLPFGLPFGAPKSPDDFRTSVHRLRSPSLLLTSPECPPVARSQADFLASRMPNVRRRQLQQSVYTPDGVMSTELAGIIREFMEVPAKRSQKNE